MVVSLLHQCALSYTEKLHVIWQRYQKISRSVIVCPVVISTSIRYWRGRFGPVAVSSSGPGMSFQFEREFGVKVALSRYALDNRRIGARVDRGIVAISKAGPRLNVQPGANVGQVADICTNIDCGWRLRRGEACRTVGVE